MKNITKLFLPFCLLFIGAANAMKNDEDLSTVIEIPTSTGISNFHPNTRLKKAAIGGGIIIGLAAATYAARCAYKDYRRKVVARLFDEKKKQKNKSVQQKTQKSRFGTKTYIGTAMLAAAALAYLLYYYKIINFNTDWFKPKNQTEYIEMGDMSSSSTVEQQTMDNFNSEVVEVLDQNKSIPPVQLATAEAIVSQTEIPVTPPNDEQPL